MSEHHSSPSDPLCGTEGRLCGALTHTRGGPSGVESSPRQYYQLTAGLKNHSAAP